MNTDLASDNFKGNDGIALGAATWLNSGSKVEKEDRCRLGEVQIHRKRAKEERESCRRGVTEMPRGSRLRAL